MINRKLCHNIPLTLPSLPRRRGEGKGRGAVQVENDGF
jgi:hypothetical protein